MGEIRYVNILYTKIYVAVLTAQAPTLVGANNYRESELLFVQRRFVLAIFFGNLRRVSRSFAKYSYQIFSKFPHSDLIIKMLRMTFS